MFHRKLSAEPPPQLLTLIRFSRVKIEAGFLMNAALSLLVNGNIAKEVMVIDLIKKRYIVSRGSKNIKNIHNVIIRLVKSSPMINYCVFQIDNGEKYVVVKLKPLRYMAVKIASEVNGEKYVVKLKTILKLLEKLSKQDLTSSKTKDRFLSNNNNSSSS